MENSAMFTECFGAILKFTLLTYTSNGITTFQQKWGTKRERVSLCIKMLNWNNLYKIQELKFINTCYLTFLVNQSEWHFIFPTEITYTRPDMLNLCSYCSILWIFVTIPILTTPIYHSTVRTLNDISGKLKRKVCEKNVFGTVRAWKSVMTEES